MRNALLIILTIFILIFIIAIFMVIFLGMDKMMARMPLVFGEEENSEVITNSPPQISNNDTKTNNKEEKIINIPINNAISRITKKPFGIKIDPETSPVQPERFSGFHTGTDFEIFENEIDTEIKIKAICDGDIIQKTSVNGYGGVIVQKCQYENNPILVLYGHINPSTFTQKIKNQKGDEIASLAPDNSPQSGFERKHLHLGVIKEERIDYRGYVQSQNELTNWIDPVELLK